MLKKNVSPQKALERLEALCARSERCTYELRLKLAAWRVPPADVEVILSRLRNARYLDDDRFTRAYINDKIRFAPGWGPRKITAALVAKHIPRSIVAEHLDAVPPHIWEENLQHILNVKAREIPDAKTYQGRTRLFRYAVSRGFNPDMIARIIRTDWA